MATQSYLLALDGSQESSAAASVAWKLTQAQNTKLVALSVVDSQAIWDLLGFKTPGFIGSGAYFAAYETMKNALRTISETLLTSFESRSQNYDVKTECLITEGDLLHQIFEQSKQHDLVIVGRRNTHASNAIMDQHSLIRTSLSKRLAAICACPLLMVPSDQAWTKARLVFSNGSFSSDALARFLSFTEPLELEREVFCVGSEENVDKLVQEVKNLVPHSVKVHCLDGAEDEEPLACAADVTTDTLLVVTTTQSSQGRETCDGRGIHEFLTSIPHLPVLVLPPGIAPECSPATVIEKMRKAGKAGKAGKQRHC